MQICYIAKSRHLFFVKLIVSNNFFFPSLVAQVDSLQENGPSVQNSPVESNVASEQQTTDGDENANDVAEMHYNLEGLETAIEESAVVPGKFTAIIFTVL